LAFHPHQQIVNDHSHHSSFVVERMLDFATAHRFTVGKLTVTLGTFGLNQFTLGPFLAFTFIAAFTFSEFTHQLTPFDLDPSLAFN
jgi:hypothetical protein